MGHHVSEDGVSPDPSAKVDAILQFPQPTNKPALQRFLGMANYLNAFCPNLSSVIHPLFQLTRKDADFQWFSVHTSAFEAARKLIADAPCLAFFDQHKPVTLQVDASDYGLGGALMQADSSGKLQPVAYMSCQLKPNEVQWAQIEKEALAICAACTKWDLWLYGKAVTVHSDHQALETIFKKPLAKAPKRLQRIMFRLQRYTINVIYRKGTSLVLADTLSRAPLSVSNDASPTNFDLFRLNVERQDLQPNVHLTSSTAKAMQHATASDPDMNQLLQVVMTGWPSSKASLPACLTPYWSMRDELSIVDGILYRGLQVLVPPSLRSSMLKKIHSSHMGVDSNQWRIQDLSEGQAQSQDTTSDVIAKRSREGEALAFLGGSGGMLPRKILKIEMLRYAFSALLGVFLSLNKGSKLLSWIVAKLESPTVRYGWVGLFYVCENPPTFYEHHIAVLGVAFSRRTPLRAYLFFEVFPIYGGRNVNDVEEFQRHWNPLSFYPIWKLSLHSTRARPRWFENARRLIDGLVSWEGNFTGVSSPGAKPDKVARYVSAHFTPTNAESSFFFWSEVNTARVDLGPEVDHVRFTLKWHFPIDRLVRAQSCAPLPFGFQLALLKRSSTSTSVSS